MLGFILTPLWSLLQRVLKRNFHQLLSSFKTHWGKPYYQKGYANSNEIVVELPDLSSQTYLVTIIADDQTFKAKLIQR